MTTFAKASPGAPPNSQIENRLKGQHFRKKLIREGIASHCDSAKHYSLSETETHLKRH